jgi:hypothetical protein
MPRRISRDMRTIHNVLTWMGPWNRKGTLGKTEDI